MKNVMKKEYKLSFIEYLVAVKELMKRHKCINGHWDTQLPRYESRRIFPTMLVRAENFSEDLTNANRLLQLNDWLPKPDNATLYPSVFKISKQDLSYTPNTTIACKKIALVANNLLSKDSKNLIAEIYQQDFEFFKYNI